MNQWISVRADKFPYHFDRERQNADCAGEQIVGKTGRAGCNSAGEASGLAAI
jgi:hypothetical protein